MLQTECLACSVAHRSHTQIGIEAGDIGQQAQVCTCWVHSVTSHVLKAADATGEQEALTAPSHHAAGAMMDASGSSCAGHHGRLTWRTWKAESSARRKMRGSSSASHVSALQPSASWASTRVTAARVSSSDLTSSWSGRSNGLLRLSRSHPLIDKASQK